MKVAKLMKTIGTHSGAFHCDEVLACFMLKQLPDYKDAEIVRSRDPETLSKCDIVVDVGAVYDPNNNRFDHHQREFDHSMQTVLGLPFTTKLSSAGLIYAHFGKDVLKNVLNAHSIEAKSLETLYKKMYERFMEEIDAIDNGISVYDGTPRYSVTTNLSARVGYLNPSWDNPKMVEWPQFKKAMEMVGSEFVDRVQYYYTSWLPARDIVKKSIESRFSVDESGSIVSFEACGGLPWKEHLFDVEAELELEVGRLMYVLYADSSNGNWRVQCIPESTLLPFQSRKALPSAWRGVRDDKLSGVTGIPDCIFCHASGFIGGNKTKEGALAMARMSLANTD